MAGLVASDASFGACGWDHSYDDVCMDVGADGFTSVELAGMVKPGSGACPTEGSELEDCSCW